MHIRLILVGYGVTYIQPTYHSLVSLQEFDRDPGVDFQNKVKVCLIDQESHRDFCDDNQIVVGTPALQMYYNTKNIRFRFLRNALDRPSDENKGTNVFIGQLHFATVNKLVQASFQTLQQLPDDFTGEVVVDIRLDALYDIEGGARDDEEGTDDSDLDSDTDSGEDNDDTNAPNLS